MIDKTYMDRFLDGVLETAFAPAGILSVVPGLIPLFLLSSLSVLPIDVVAVGFSSGILMTLKRTKHYRRNDYRLKTDRKEKATLLLTNFPDF